MDAGETIRAARQRAGLTQVELARRAGTSQAAVAAYERNRKTPGLATLSRLAAEMRARLKIEIVPEADDEYRERPVEDLSREERRSLWLHREIAARIQADPESAKTLARRNLAGLRQADVAKRGEQWRREWEALLDGPLDTMLVALCSTSQHAAQLRQTAPFAGLLAPRERWALYRSFAASQ